MGKNVEKLVELDNCILNVLGVDFGEVFILKDLNGHIIDDWFRYKDYGIEYFDKYHDGWVMCASPSLTDVLNGTCEIVKCIPKVYSNELEILRR